MARSVFSIIREWILLHLCNKYNTETQPEILRLELSHVHLIFEG